MDKNFFQQNKGRKDDKKKFNKGEKRVLKFAQAQGIVLQTDEEIRAYLDETMGEARLTKT